MADALHAAYPEALAKAERAEIERRRAAADFFTQLDDPKAPAREQRTGPPPENGLPADTVGIALSGGGIRSATFCLGVFRALARQHALGKFDFMSTVSGGGYFGSFLGGLFLPRDEGGRQQRPFRPRAEAQLLDLHSNPSDWLRENGRYMAPNGSGDTLLAGAILLRNWLALLLVVASLLFTVLAATAWITMHTDVLGWMIRRESVLLPLSADGGGARVLALPAALAIVAVVPLAWAFWFTQRGWGLVPALIALALVLALVLGLKGWRTTPGASLLSVEAGLALVYWLVVLGLAFRGEGSRARLQRNYLSRGLSIALWTALALLAVGLVAALGRYLATAPTWAVWTVLAGTGGVLPTAFGWAQKAAPLLGGQGRAARVLTRPMVMAAIGASLVAGLLIVGLCTAAYAADARGFLGKALIAAALITLACAWTIPFLNLSSHNSLYGARLTRAYLGASNARRHQQHNTITELVPGDAIPLREYDPQLAGGPLHLINVTLNETVSGKSQIEQRDRKGLSMAVGPCGVSVGRRHHALWHGETRGGALDPVVPADPKEAKEFRIFATPNRRLLTPEELDLGDWVSVSGAAFTTGLGARTSLSLSILLGLTNVRLGYWWRSGTNPAWSYHAATEREPWGAALERSLSWLLPVQSYLLDELLARFHGPNRTRWYLSDGGHSENTGAYELVRRRVPFIVICDCGCDPLYQFEDLANLARRVRIDFDAEVSVFTRKQLNQVLPAKLRRYFGTVEDFALGSAPRPHALLAGVFYDDKERARQPGSVILLLKPSLGGDEPADVVQYGAGHKPFPNETTIDQFFDEAQWESYRRLGEHVASRVFEDVPAAWRPLDLCTPPLEHMHWDGAARGLGDQAPAHPPAAMRPYAPPWQAGRSLG